MKLDSNFSKECQRLVNDALKDMLTDCHEITPDSLMFLNNKIFLIAYSIVLTYHNTLADALKEKGIDIGHLE